jgi:hypothetical protein
MVLLLFVNFSLFNGRKIDPAFTVTATALFGKQTFINKPAYIKYSCSKQYGYYDYLDIHVTNLIQIIYIRNRHQK